MSFEEYEILGILGDSVNAPVYKVRNKITSAVFTWHAVNTDNYNHAEKQMLIKKINERKVINHPNFLKFYNYIECEQNNVLYVSMEFCKNGTLRSFIKKCLNEQKGINEFIIAKIIYVIAFVFKTSKNNVYNLTLDNVYLDDNYNIKVLNFDFEKSTIKDNMKINQLGSLIYQLCNLQTEETCLKHVTLNSHYSIEFQSLIKGLLEETGQVTKQVDKLLCHPTILLKSSQLKKDEYFYKLDTVNNDSNNEKCVHKNENEINLQAKIQALRKWESSLKTYEERLAEKEHSLKVREKKLAIMERTVKEKLTKAELYIKRCRESKSSSSNSSSKDGSSKSQKLSYENLDNSVSADCGDSVIVPTSNKLNIDKIVKPSNFIRTLSERRVRFKGHSPLKELNFNKRTSRSTLKEQSANNFSKQKFTESLAKISENNNFEKRRPEEKKPRKLLQRPRSKIRSDENKTVDIGDVENECRPISWSDENKKQAFELLRVMNSAIQMSGGDPSQLKHTYL